MSIDIFYLVIFIFAVISGLRKGLILGIFSLLTFIVALAAALKLSAVVAVYLEAHGGGAHKWLPMLSFVIVFILFAFLIAILGKLIKKALHLAMLGMVDTILGALLYVFIYTILFSIFLFYLQKMGVISPETIGASKVYPFIAPVGPWLIDNLGKIIPFFKNIFDELSTFFDSFAHKAS
jgi:membrane protein required for colicin V production